MTVGSVGAIGECLAALIAPQPLIIDAYNVGRR
jgi:hypothetical protein